MEEYIVLWFAPLLLGLWFWAISDIARSRFKSTCMNLVWLLIVILFPALGSVVYLIFRKSQIVKEPRRFNPRFNR